MTYDQQVAALTVHRELMNRNWCARGLIGVRIMHVNPGKGEYVIAGIDRCTHGIDKGHLTPNVWLTVEGSNAVFSAIDCLLMSPWPVVCCKPRRKNIWNQSRVPLDLPFGASRFDINALLL